MKHITLAVLLLAPLTLLHAADGPKPVTPVTAAQPGSSPERPQEDSRLELATGGQGAWNFYPDENRDPALPRVLLIGDSIVNGYRNVVIRELKHNASVDVWLTPAAENSPGLHDDLRKVLAQGPYAVVHFNIGLHGWEPGKIPEGQYEPLMRKYVATLRENAPSAKLVWASSTPITKKNRPTEFDPADNPTIANRNTSAAQIMRESDISVNDLYSLVADKLQMARGDRYHWTPPAYDLMGKQVARFIAGRISSKPNIIVIVSDDAGYAEFSMHGSKTIPTPRIDSIAANGVGFSNGYVSGSVCSPTRAGLLTGRYQNRFGHEFNIPPVYSESNGLPLTETTLPSVLKDAGYRTIALGKWHLGYAPKFHPLSRGFDDYYGFLQGARSYFPLEKPTRLNQLLRDREPVQPEKFDYMTDELARGAAEYIVANKARPFFMYLAFNATHGPNHVTEEDLAKTNGNKIAAMTIALDRAVGVVLDELKSQSLTDNTLVIFVNDNGGATGHDNSPLRGRKGQAWEGGIRVPFAMQWPGTLPQGKVMTDPVISLDIFPTAMAVAGVAKSPGNPLDGVNLIPFLTGERQGRPHQTLFWKNGNSWAVRDGDLKLVMGSKDATTLELFDMATDMLETANLVDSRPADVERLQKLYDQWSHDFPAPLWGGKRASVKNSTPTPGSKKRKNAKSGETP